TGHRGDGSQTDYGAGEKSTDNRAFHNAHGLLSVHFSFQLAVYFAEKPSQETYPNSRSAALRAAAGERRKKRRFRRIVAMQITTSPVSFTCCGPKECRAPETQLTSKAPSVAF